MRIYLPNHKPIRSFRYRNIRWLKERHSTFNLPPPEFRYLSIKHRYTTPRGSPGRIPTTPHSVSTHQC